MTKLSSALAQSYHQFPFEISRGEGVYLWDTNGKRYLDLYGGHAVAILGQSPQRVNQAIAKQAESLFFYSNLTPLEIRERAAQSLINFAGDAFAQVFFCNSGAEANENALKLAIQKTGRQKIVSCQGGFHGRTFLSLAATDNKVWHASFSDWLGPVSFIVPNALESIVEIDQDTAAVILEPIQSMAGAIVLEREFLQDVQKRCKEVGAMLIFDEVQTGMGRTGVPFVAGTEELFPDMSTTAKSLASGFPVGALLISESLSNEIELGDLGSTFGGGPLAAAAVQATIEEIQEGKLVENAAEIFYYVKERLKLPMIEEIRGAGCLIGIRFKQEARPILRALLEKGIIAGVSADKNTLRLLPPLIIEKQHIDVLASALEDI